MKDLLLRISERLMRSPAAPYHEELVASEVIAICRELELSCKPDSFGNLILSAAKRPAKAPIVLAAHMDHPGFRIHRQISPTQFAADFLGGVGDSYFKPGTLLRLMPGNIPASLSKRIDADKRTFEIQAASNPPAPPGFAVWDLPEFSSDNNHITGRVCDDLIGCATILTVLTTLRGSPSAVNVIGALTRAEEVGFHGALALAQSRRLPRKSLIISLETSREMPPVQMGNGVIIRVGDRASTFDSASTRFLAEVASDLGKANPHFKFQRALMSGGTCEATAYQEYGFRCAAVCVALGNYHNCGANDLIQPEFVASDDAVSMAELLVECARHWTRSDSFASRLPKRLERLSREALRELKKRPIQLPEAEVLR